MPSRASRSIGLMIFFFVVAAFGVEAQVKSTASTNGSVILIDDAGRSVEIPQPLERVVVANRYNNELIRAIGAIDRVVAVDMNTAQDRLYWKCFDPANTIGKGQSELNYEKIASLAPQLLVLPKNGKYEEAAEKLRPFGINVFVITGWDNSNIAKQIELAGRLFGREKEAAGLVEFYQKPLLYIQKQLAKVPTRKTVYWEYDDPYSTCIPGTSNDGWHNMIVSAGGVNIFGDPGLAGKVIDPESVLLKNPDLIVKIFNGGKAMKGTGVYTPPTRAESVAAAKVLLDRPGWNGLRAIKGQKLYLSTAFASGGLGKMIGTVYIAKWLYPEIMGDLDPDAIFNEWIEKYQKMPNIPGHFYHAEGY